MDDKLFYDYENSSCSKINKVVTINNPIYKSFQGKYFMGQTGEMILSPCCNAYAALFNPQNSNFDLFFSVFTVTNYSDVPLNAEVWLIPSFTPSGIESDLVSPANIAIKPIQIPKVKLLYDQFTNKPKWEGTNVFDRIVSPYSTLADEKDGKIIIPPDGAFLVKVASISTETSKIRIAFGWWEE